MVKPPKGLYGFSLLVACATLLLIGAGGLVTSNGAGLSVPDWPLSFGKLFPAMRGPMVWEHSHRLVAGSVGVLSLILTFWISFTEKRKWVIGLVWLSFGLIFLQALLGGLTVLMKLPPSVSIAHAVIGQVFLGFSVSLAFFMSPYYMRNQLAQKSYDSTLSLFSGLGLLFVLMQLILGSIARHTHGGILEHIIFALGVTLLLLALVFYVIYHHAGRTNLLKTGVRLAAVLIVQIFLGIGAFVFKALAPLYASSVSNRVVFTAMHQTVGALVLGMVVLMWLMSFFPEQERAL